jgi:hypothetical protein
MSALRSFTSSLQDAASSAVNAVEDTASSAAATVQAAASSAVDTASATVGSVTATASAAVAADQETASSAIDTAKATASAAVDTVTATTSAAVATVQDTASAAVGTVSAAAATVQDAASSASDTASAAVGAVGDAASGATGGGGSSGLDNEALTAMVKAEITKQVNAIPGDAGVLGELNDLENYRDTDAPVPDVTTSFADLSLSALNEQITEKEFAIAQLEASRIEICKKARTDARLAVSDARKNLTLVLAGPTVVGALVGGAIGLLAGPGGAAAGAITGGIVGLVTGVIADHELYRQLLETLKSIVEKAKADLRPINTKIVFENKKLAAMKRAKADAEEVFLP